MQWLHLTLYFDGNTQDVCSLLVAAFRPISHLSPSWISAQIKGIAFLQIAAHPCMCDVTLLRFLMHIARVIVLHVLAKSTDFRYNFLVCHTALSNTRYIHDTSRTSCFLSRTHFTFWWRRCAAWQPWYPRRLFCRCSFLLQRNLHSMTSTIQTL